ncbi:unnamed protein product [Rhodiola kirilowii]
MSVTSSLPMRLCFLSLLLVHGVSQQLYVDERSVLLELKEFWQSPPSIAHWKNTTNPCTWPEITCTDDSVTGISLQDRNITVTIPSIICYLGNLNYIELSLNYIPGNFPKSLYNCSKLQYLDLSQNFFVGPIPSDIDQMGNLRHLNLGANNFSGDIQKSIGNLTKLQSLQLFQNQFNGSFPPEIGNLANLEVLEMAFNKFLPAELPENFMKLSKLKSLWMQETNLNGELSEKMGNLVDLEYLDLAANNLSGTIPRSLFLLKNLTDLYLYQNKFSGEIPRVIEAVNLLDIDLSINNLNGTIPGDFGKLVMLKALGLFHNQLTGAVPESIGRLPALQHLKLFTNSLSGSLPADFGKFSKLKAFEVASNSFTGNLPENLCYHGKLLGIAALDNQLSGELPESIGNCSSLLVLIIQGNKFSGNFPSGIWNLPGLETLTIGGNSFTGQLPGELGGNLTRIEIQNNDFSGEIPLTVSRWTNLIVLKASSNRFTGKVPKELTALPLLTTILLDDNKLSGELPSDILSWYSLTLMNFSNNQLTGLIPEEFGSLPRLQELDLSANQFYGAIPDQIGNLRLTFLNLSSNHLSGSVPSSLEISIYKDSFLDNLDLCSNIPSFPLEYCSYEVEKTTSTSRHILVIIFSLLGTVFIVLVISTAFYRISRRRRRGDYSNPKITSFQRLNFTEEKILSSLMECNVLGSGGSGIVYRVPTTSSGEFVAVKKLFSDSKQERKLKLGFEAEVRTLSRVRHLNIVRLLCSITTDDSKLLVYEYMENGSLDMWLHKKKIPHLLAKHVGHKTLDWPTRFNIAVGAAQGLFYMHHDCSPPIIHRDVKSSNILLDSAFNAKLADFGLAKMLVERVEINTSAVAGSVGYMPPEYAHTTRASEKIDVYSFGVILFELVTGTEATDGGEEDKGLAEWAWHHVHTGKAIVDALDKEIKEDHYIDEMTAVFKLGIICTSKLPSSRPTMQEVLQFLLRYRSSAYGHKNPRRNEYDDAPLLKK